MNLNSIFNTRFKGVVEEDRRPLLIEDKSIDAAIHLYIDRYIDSNDGAAPTHVYVNTVVFREILNVTYARNKIKLTGSLKTKMSFRHPKATCDIVIVDEPGSFILMGDEKTYNDYIMEREILGDHS